jgi:integrase/recombinase XerD
MGVINLPTTNITTLTFTEALGIFLRERQVRGLSPSTVRFYQERLYPLVKWVEEYHPGATPATATTDLLRDFLLHLHDKGVTPATRNASLRAIKALFGFLVRDEYISDSPARRIPKIRQPQKLLRVLSAEELCRLLSSPDISTELGKRDAALLLLLADTGARISEVLKAHIADITWGDQHRSDSLRVVGKGQRERRLPFGSDCRRALLDHLRLRGQELDEDEWIFPSSRYRERPLSVMQAQKICERHSRAAGINPPIRPHVLRRSFATLLHRNGAREYDIQALLGHSTLDMTRRYCQIADDDLQETHRRYGVVESVLRDPTASRRVRLPGQGKSHP